MGRRSTYTPEIAAQICERLAAGESLLHICSADDMPGEATVRAWAMDDREGFAARYTRARNIGLDHYVDAMVEIAADRNRDARCRAVEIDAIKWRACKLAPKKYGDRLELAGDKDNPLVPHKITIELVKAKEQGEND